VKKGEQINLLHSVYADLLLIEAEGKHHTEGELLYIKNAQNSVEVCLKSKSNKKKKIKNVA
jgi:hypothetical protein